VHGRDDDAPQTDPDTVWAAKLHHHIAGTVNHMPVRGVVEAIGDGFGFTPGPAWLRDCGLAFRAAAVDDQACGVARRRGAN
jgi:hypothetical protein